MSEQMGLPWWVSCLKFCFRGWHALGAISGPYKVWFLKFQILTSLLYTIIANEWGAFIDRQAKPTFQNFGSWLFLTSSVANSFAAAMFLLSFFSASQRHIWNWRNSLEFSKKKKKFTKWYIKYIYLSESVASFWNIGVTLSNGWNSSTTATR